MIVTSKSSELAVHSHVFDDGLQTWRDVHLEAEIPYFMVIYSVSETKGRVRQTCLIWRDVNLITLCDQIEADPNSNLIRVCLLSPPWMNGSNIWQIDSMKKITEAVHHVVGRNNCYELENGKRLVDSNTFPYSNDWQAMNETFAIDRYTCISDFDSPQCIEIFTAVPVEAAVK